MLACGCAWLRSRAARAFAPAAPKRPVKGVFERKMTSKGTSPCKQLSRRRYVAEGLLIALILYGFAAAPGFLSAASSTISLPRCHEVRK